MCPHLQTLRKNICPFPLKAWMPQEQWNDTAIVSTTEVPINSTNTFFWNVYSGGIDHMFLFLTTMYCSKLEWSDADFILHLFLQVTCKVRGIFLDLNPQGFWCLSRNYFQHNFNSSMYWEVRVLITYQGKHAHRASTFSKAQFWTLYFRLQITTGKAFRTNTFSGLPC